MITSWWTQESKDPGVSEANQKSCVPSWLENSSGMLIFRAHLSKEPITSRLQLSAHSNSDQKTTKFIDSWFKDGCRGEILLHVEPFPRSKAETDGSHTYQSSCKMPGQPAEKQLSASWWLLLHSPQFSRAALESSCRADIYTGSSRLCSSFDIDVSQTALPSQLWCICL